MTAGMRRIAFLFVATNAIAAPEVRFYQPFQYGEVRRVTCAWDHGSHVDKWNRYAIDYDLPVGTPVVAAADGVVIAVEDRFAVRDGDPAHNNQIAIRHADGRVSVYLHLREKGAVVRVDQHVRHGDLIGYSGETGAASGPHLHFGVQERLGGASVQFRFADFGGDGMPKFDNLVTSFNFPERYEAAYHEIEATVTFFGIARRLGCIEVVADRLAATSDIRMVMPLKALEDMLARRDAALLNYDQLADDALCVANNARSRGDLAAAVRLLGFGARDYSKARTGPQVKHAWSELQKERGCAAAWAALDDERAYRRLVADAIRAHMDVGNVIREGKAYATAVRLYEVALKAAPESCREDLARLVAELKAYK
jgi:hypothetical protein